MKKSISIKILVTLLVIFFIFIISDTKTVYGFIDKNGKTVIKPIYSEASSFSNGYASVKLGNKLGLIDKTGNYIIKPIYEPNNIEAFVAKYHKAINDKKIEEFCTMPNSSIEKSSKYISDLKEGLLAVKVNNKWGFIDKTGEFTIKPQFDTADNFKEGLSLVSIGKN